VLFVRKKFFHPNLRGDSPEKFISGKIFLPSPLPPPLANIFGENMKKWHRGINFSSNVVISETGCGNFP
jgi:hypothetical protein